MTQRPFALAAAACIAAYTLASILAAAGASATVTVTMAAAMVWVMFGLAERDYVTRLWRDAHYAPRHAGHRQPLH